MNKQRAATAKQTIIKSRPETFPAHPVRPHTTLFGALLIAATVLSFGALPRVTGAAGDLDPSFGVGGKVTTDFFGNNDAIGGVALQSDGKIVVAGYSLTNNNRTGVDFSLARYNSDGSLDRSFGSNGKLNTDFANSLDQAAAIVIQPLDGKLVAVGQTQSAPGRRSFALVRYTGAGSLDATFGTGGKVTTNFFGGIDTANAALIQPDGKVLVAGSETNALGFLDFALARYNSDGSLDVTFGNGGKQTTDFFGNNERINAIVLQPDGKIVASGAATRAGGSVTDFALARYNSDGTLDCAFGTGGLITTSFSSNSVASGLALQSDGKIVAAGNAGAISTFALARYNADGTLDATFGSNGQVLTAFPGSRGDRANAVVVQTDGNIVVAGLTNNGASQDFGLARYSGTDGSLDPSFGAGGLVTTDFIGGSDTIAALALQPNGNLIAAGLAFNGGSYDFGVARYFTTATPPPPPPLPGKLPSLSKLTLTPATVTGFCQNSIGQVTLNSPAPAGGIVVALSNANPAATVPANVTVPEGATTANFDITTSRVSVQTKGNVTASFNGANISQTLTVMPGC
ncbi:MAG: delta-60 repeat domain-containing protein [Verrucomicrobiota bacterium]|nr:delta-60 repeat domain-containing protein [Verrucomicrobiota bacterium]